MAHPPDGWTDGRNRRMLPEALKMFGFSGFYWKLVGRNVCQKTAILGIAGHFLGDPLLYDTGDSPALITHARYRLGRNSAASAGVSSSSCTALGNIPRRTSEEETPEYSKVWLFVQSESVCKGLFRKNKCPSLFCMNACGA